MISDWIEKLFGKNWRTAAAAIVLAVSLNGAELGLNKKLVSWATTISVIFFGLNAKDRNVTGGSIFQGDSPSVQVQRAVQDKEVEPIADAIQGARHPEDRKS